LTDKHQINASQLGLDANRDSTGPDLGSLQAEELKMREALGLHGRGERQASRPQPEQSRPNGDRPANDRPMSNGHSNGHRHRFVQDGEVPVVLAKHSGPGGVAALVARGTNAPSGTNRVAALSADLGMERAARERAERGLNQALANVRDLQTKLAHVELARSEAVESARVLQERITTMRVAQQERADKASVELLVERRAREAAEATLQAALAAAEAPRKAARAAKPAMTRASVKKTTVPRSVREPKPVRWWVRSEPAAKR
jgi:hypothetical protein